MVKELRLPIEHLSLKRLYEFYATGDLRGVSEKTRRAYAKAADTLLAGLPEGLSFVDFREELASRILEELGLAKALETLRKEGLPATPESLTWALGGQGVRLGKTSARALLRLLKALGVLRERPIPVVVTGVKQRVYEYVLAKGSVKYKRLELRFENTRQAVLELVKEGKLGVRFGREELGLEGVDDWEDAKASLPKPFLESWRDEKGVERRRVVIPGDAVVYVKL